MEKSKRISHQVDTNPSAPPVNLQSPIHHKDFISPASHQGHNRPGSNYDDFQSDVLRRAPPQPRHAIQTVDSTYDEQSERYCRKLHRNRRQFGSICGGLLLMLVSGLHIGWGIWRTGEWPIQATNTSLFHFTIMAWPFGAIFGSFIGSALVTVLRKSIIYYLTAVIMIIGNLLHIIWDRDYTAIVFGRLLTSLAHGIVFIALITHAGENASKNMRGTILSTITCMLNIAIFISVHVTSNVRLDADFSAERIIAIIALIFILASIICTVTVTVETIPYLLRKNQPNVAMQNMKHLHVGIVSPQIKREMEELKTMIMQDKQDDRIPFSNRNLKPLLQMITIRLMAALTNNFLLNYVLIRFCELILYNYRYAPLLIVAPRLAMSVLQTLYADVFPRKIQIIVAASLAGLTLFGLGIFLNIVNVTSSVNYYIPSIFCIFFQLFSSMGIDQMSDVYLSEAFSTAKKPWSLSFVMVIEHTFQIFMSGMAFTTIAPAGLYALLFISGTFVIVIAIILMFTLPETKGMTLKQARDVLREEKILSCNIGSRYS